MRVLIVSNNLGFGGKERQIIELLSVFSQCKEHFFGVVLRENIIQYDIDFIDRISLFIPNSQLNFIELFIFHRKVIKRFQPDVIHTWEGIVALSVTLNCILSKCRIPIIDGSLRYSKTYSKKGLQYWINRFNRTLSIRIVTNSNAGINSIDYGKSGKSLVISNGMNFSRFNIGKTPIIEPQARLNIGMVSSFSRPKDYKSLVKAALMLLNENTNLHFFFVGDGSEKYDVEKLIPTEAKKHFTFTGSLSKPEEIMVNFNIGVLLSKIGHSEGLSNSVMEYLALGLPVVCTNTGGNVELVKDGINGFLVQHESVEQVYEKLKILINNMELRLQMGEISKSIAFDNYDIQFTAQQYLDLYNSVIKK